MFFHFVLYPTKHTVIILLLPNFLLSLVPPQAVFQCQHSYHPRNLFHHTFPKVSNFNIVYTLFDMSSCLFAME
jgi:hypothetical protein